MRLTAAQDGKYGDLAPRSQRSVVKNSRSPRKATSGGGSQTEDQEGADEEERGRSGEGGLDVEGGPEKADEEAGEEVADGVDGGERAEGHAVLFFGDQLGGERIFERFFGT